MDELHRVGHTRKACSTVTYRHTRLVFGGPLRTQMLFPLLALPDGVLLLTIVLPPLSESIEKNKKKKKKKKKRRKNTVSVVHLLSSLIFSQTDRPTIARLSYQTMRDHGFDQPPPMHQKVTDLVSYSEA